MMTLVYKEPSSSHLSYRHDYNTHTSSPTPCSPSSPPLLLHTHKHLLHEEEEEELEREKERDHTVVTINHMPRKHKADTTNNSNTHTNNNTHTNTKKNKKKHDDDVDDDVLKGKENVHTQTGQDIRDGIYGALDGIITTFGCVSGVAGADLSAWIALILGIANLVADGLSMAVGNYIGTKSEIEYERRERRRQEHRIDTYASEEREEVRRIYHEKGFRGMGLEMAVDVICADKKIWVDTLMVEKMGILPEERSALWAATLTFLSFNVAGAVPLLVYVAAVVFPSLTPIAYNLCVIVTLCAIFALGAFKGFMSGTFFLKSGIEMLLLGSLAAGAAFTIGHVLHGMGVQS